MDTNVYLPRTVNVEKENAHWETMSVFMSCWYPGGFSLSLKTVHSIASSIQYIQNRIISPTAEWGPCSGQQPEEPSSRQAREEARVSEWREQSHLKQHGLCKCDLIASTENGSDLSRGNRGPWWPRETRLWLFFPSPRRTRPLKKSWCRIHFGLLRFPSSSCLLVVDLHFSSFSVKPVKLNRICHMTDCDKFTTGNRGKVWDKEIGLFCLSRPWFSSDSKGSVPPTESRKPLPVAVWFILEGH